MAAYTTIDDPSLYFRIKIYEGNETNDTAITWDETDTSMQPDLLWFKSRDNAQGNAVFDSVRGALKRLIPNETGAEGDEATNLDSFDSNGFTVDNEAIVNHDSMVCWGWKESATSGFDIVARTGDGNAGTVSHNLSAVPRFIITKCRSATEQWIVQHGGLGATKHLVLDSTAAESTAGNRWNDTTPTTSVYSIGTDADVNGNTETFIDYVWAGIQGFSKFGKYTGNGAAAGPFIFTGMSPAWVMIKKASATESWHIFDNKRDINENNIRLQANTSGADDSTESGIDMLSNGFKVRTDWVGINTDDGTYVYAAFAEAPFVNSEGVPCNAR